MLVGSYVLSQARGNYSGLFDYDYVQFPPNISAGFDDQAATEYADGLLPQDRRHSIKLSASYMTEFGLAVGTRFLWQTGTPLSIRGGSPTGMTMFLAERGSMGETPNIWDLDLRFVYDIQGLARRSAPARIVLDLFNVGSPRTAVDYDQICCFTMTEDGHQTDVNPHYLEPIRFQQPMMVRLGLEVSF
jgi:hypothetical protein